MPDQTAVSATATAPPRPWLTGNVKVLSAVSFLQDAASDMLYPVLPIFLTSVLGAPVAVVGAIEGAADAAAAATKYLAGRAADRVARKPLITSGYGLAALGKLLIAVATVWPLVLAARVVDRIGKGLRSTPRDALLVDGVPREYRGRVFGLHRAADSAGAVAGPLLGLALYEALGHRMRPLFWVALVPAVLSVALTRAVREHTERAPERTAPMTTPPTSAPRPGVTPAGAPPDATPPFAAGARPRSAATPWRALGGPFWQVFGVLALFAVVNFPDALLLLRARALGLSLAGVIAAYALFNLTNALGSYPAGHLSDRWRRPFVYALGLGCFAAGYLGLALATHTWQVYVIFAVYGGFNACTDGVGKAWISTLVPDGTQGTAQGLYQGVTGVAVLAAGVWAGLAWHGNGRLPLLIAGAAGAIMMVVTFTIGLRTVWEELKRLNH